MMAPEQFEAEKNYLAAREIAEGFLEKFSPQMGKLIAATGQN